MSIPLQKVILTIRFRALKTQRYINGINHSLTQ